MIKDVLQSGNYGLFTQIALVLFFLAFVVLLVINFLRPRSQTDKIARLPLEDDDNITPITPRTAEPIGNGQGDHNQ